MKPFTQKILLVALAAVSLGTTGLVLLKGAVENAKHDPEYHLHHGQHDGHDHAHHHGPGAAVADTTSDRPDNFGPAPAFDFVNQDNQPVTLASYRGKAVIGCFIFTRCMGPCPMISAQMASLQSQLADSPLKGKVQLVSFSVDPTYDTPQVLTRYAQTYKADTADWSFLTGPRQAMWSMIVDGYHLGLQDTPDDKVSPILHSTKLVLIDPQGRLRGYYSSQDPDSRATMLRHLEMILAEKSSDAGKAP